MPDKNHLYSQFNFMLECDGIDGMSICAGFEEISGIAMETMVAEYREGSGNNSELIKVSRAATMSNITFKRGIVDSLELQEWFDKVRTGLQKRLQNVTVTSLGDDQTVVTKWRLSNVWPVKLTGPSFNTEGTDATIEELVLTVESIRLVK